MLFLYSDVLLKNIYYYYYVDSSRVEFLSDFFDE